MHSAISASAAKTMMMSTIENADACGNCSSVMLSRMRVVKSVHRAETRNIVALIAVIQWMNRYRIPVRIAGMMSGIVTCVNARSR